MARLGGMVVVLYLTSRVSKQATAVGDVKLTWRRLKSRSSSFERPPTTQWSPPNTLVCSGWPGGTCDAPLWLATRGRTEEDEQEKHRPCSLRVRPSLF